MNRFLKNFEFEDTTPRTSPAASDDSLLEQEKNQHIRNVFPSSPDELEGYRPMRVALVQTAAGLKPPSGGFRGNYASLLALQKHGHMTMQFAWATRQDIYEAVAELKSAGRFSKQHFQRGTVQIFDKDSNSTPVTWTKFTNTHGILCVTLDAETMIPTYPNPLQQEDAAAFIRTGSVPARAVPYMRWLQDHIIDFNATHVVFNDAFASVATCNLLADIQAGIARVEVVHTLEQLPTGPYAGGISGGAQCPEELRLFKELDGLIAVSKAVQRYAKDHCGLHAEMIPNHAWSYKDKETSDWPRYRSNFAKQNVVMINPAWVKGYDIFLAMARDNAQRKVENNWDALLDRPVYNFIAYLGWGSSPKMVQDLKAAGVKVEESVTDMEPVFDNMSVLIMPSLWQEAWGLSATEAQLRGIPVIASNVGGLQEAKRYVTPFINVNTVSGQERNEKGEYVIPVQDVKPWMKELDSLLTDKDRYEAVSHMAFYTTREWIRNFDVRGMEKYLLDVMK
ncbi:hypothetical protein LTS08_000428 [Lithohypha guttulata]|nr:hypothetical protein LTS08_000428 [Lithohypha guttulata]